MCGIVGLVSTQASADHTRFFAKAIARLAHRGPDGAGEYHSADGRVSFGHRRLTIIDLSNASAQPLQTAGVAVTFNGEIYNYKELRRELEILGGRFRSSGDTEVIAIGYEFWGRDVFERLQGMFAIAIHDKRAGHVVLARDRFGIKPLYVRTSAGRAVAFASELKALPPTGSHELNPSALIDVLAWGHPMSQESVFSGISSLPPGTVLELRLADREVVFSETTLSSSDPSPKIRSSRPADVRDVLEASVRDHMIADVPIAVALSGGLDSSVVAALAARQTDNLTAFTFTSGVESDPEVEHARVVCNRAGLRHQVLRMSPPDLEGLLDTIALHVEEPLANPNLIPTFLMSSEIHRAGYKVIMVGEGSDEVFAGYPWHGLALRSALDHSPDRMFDALFDRCGLFRKEDLLTTKGRTVLRDRMAAWKENFERTVFEGGKASLGSLLLHDRRYQMQFSQLQRIDRMTMAHGIEARVPYLYDPVLRVANELPDALRIGPSWRSLFGRREKIALAECARDLLPRSIRNRPKFGRRGTVNLWKTPLTAGIDQVFQDVLSAPRYAESREAVAEWIDWSKLAGQSLGKREKFFLTMLQMTIRHHLRDYSAVAS